MAVRLQGKVGRPCGYALIYQGVAKDCGRLTNAWRDIACGWFEARVVTSGRLDGDLRLRRERAEESKSVVIHAQPERIGADFGRCFQLERGREGLARVHVEVHGRSLYE